MGEAQLHALGPRPAGFVSGSFIAAQLSSAILSGSLPAGTPVRQQELADHFGVSRMPVREALREVQAKGLLEHRPNRTPIVVAPSANDDPRLTLALARIEQLEKELRRSRAMFDKITDCEVCECVNCKDLSLHRRREIDCLLAQPVTEVTQ